MRPNDAYLALDPNGAEVRSAVPDTVAQFLTFSLLGAREQARMPSNQGGFDEDVNVYLVGLMARFLESAYHEQASRYVHASDLDLADAVRRGADERLSFRLYKTNADHLLLAIGLFQHVAGAEHSQAFFRRQPEEFIGRGSSYYNMASSSLRRLRRRATAQEAALSKLAAGFEGYVSVLKHLRTSYFHLMGRLGEGTLFHLTRHASVEDDPADRASLYDRFLDAFSAWRDDRGEESYASLEHWVERLRDADPDFVFEMPEPDAA